MTKQTDEAIRYLESNPNIQQDRYSMEALHYIKQALQELEELRRSNKELRKQLDEAYSKMPHANDCLVGEEDE
jgi:cell shape-determining protein MreC